MLTAIDKNIVDDDNHVKNNDDAQDDDDDAQDDDDDAQDDDNHYKEFLYEGKVDSRKLQSSLINHHFLRKLMNLATRKTTKA